MKLLLITTILFSTLSFSKTKYNMLIEDENSRYRIINVEKTGSYYDNAKILWDERLISVMPPAYQAQLNTDNAYYISTKAQKNAASAALRVKRNQAITYFSNIDCELLVTDYLRYDCYLKKWELTN